MGHPTPTLAERLAEGLKWHEAGKLAQAEQAYRQVLRESPDQAEATHLLGVIALQVGKHGVGIPLIEKAVALEPDNAIFRANLGSALGATGRFEEAAAHLSAAVARDPIRVDAHNNLGLSLSKLGRLAEALDCFERVLRLQPDHAEAHYNRATTWLRRGDFARGWREFEWRWQLRATAPHPYRQPMWDGRPLAGRPILLHAEQGLGDTIQFIRYASRVRALGGRVVVRCQPALARLLKTCRGVDALHTADDTLEPCDVRAPLMSLPGILGTTLDSMPAAQPYLAAEPDLVDRWWRALEPYGPTRVGIAWQGRPTYPGDCFRSIPRSELAPLSRVPGVRLISLQKVNGTEQLTRGAPFPVVELPDLDRASGPLVDTAAVMQSLDLVVTSDTVIAHLAGALGVPVWLALSSDPDWRWMLDRADSPWYPSMRLFRQTRLGDWPSAVNPMATALSRMV
jgi:tetratricopeptide (TPR) repeat protein